MPPLAVSNVFRAEVAPASVLQIARKKSDTARGVFFLLRAPQRKVLFLTIFSEIDDFWMPQEHNFGAAILKLICKSQRASHEVTNDVL